DQRAARKPDQHADRAQQCTFDRQHHADLPARETEVPQHAELGPSCKHLCTDAGCDPEQADDHSDELEHISDRERAIEDCKGELAQLTRLPNVVATVRWQHVAYLPAYLFHRSVRLEP